MARTEAVDPQWEEPRWLQEFSRRELAYLAHCLKRQLDQALIESRKLAIAIENHEEHP